MKNNNFFKPKKISKKAGIFFFFFAFLQISLMSDSTEVDSYICLSFLPTVIFHMSYSL